MTRRHRWPGALCDKGLTGVWVNISRRSFLKLGGAVAVAAVAVPVVEWVAQAGVFIPSDRLEMGVPRHILKPEPTILMMGPSNPTLTLTELRKAYAEMRGQDAWFDAVSYSLDPDRYLYAPSGPIGQVFAEEQGGPTQMSAREIVLKLRALVDHQRTGSIWEHS